MSSDRYGQSNNAKVYSETSQISKMDLLVKAVSDLKTKNETRNSEIHNFQ